MSGLGWYSESCCISNNVVSSPLTQSWYSDNFCCNFCCIFFSSLTQRSNLKRLGVRKTDKEARNPNLHMRTRRLYDEMIGILKIVVSFILSYIACYLQQNLLQLEAVVSLGTIMAAIFLAQHQAVHANRPPKRSLCVTQDITEQTFQRNYRLGYEDFTAICD